MSAVRDTITMSELRPLINAQTIDNTTPVNGAIIDTAGFGAGVGFYVGATTYTSGDFTVSIEDGDESNLSDAAEILPEMYITQRASRRVISAASGAGATMLGVGCFSTRRFVRVVITGANTPNAVFQANALLTPQIAPAS